MGLTLPFFWYEYRTYRILKKIISNQLHASRLESVMRHDTCSNWYLELKNAHCSVPFWWWEKSANQKSRPVCSCNSSLRLASCDSSIGAVVLGALASTALFCRLWAVCKEGLLVIYYLATYSQLWESNISGVHGAQYQRYACDLWLLNWDEQHTDSNDKVFHRIIPCTV